MVKTYQNTSTGDEIPKAPTDCQKQDGLHDLSFEEEKTGRRMTLKLIQREVFDDNI